MEANSGDPGKTVRIPRRRQSEEIEHRLGRLARKRVEAQVFSFSRKLNKEELSLMHDPGQGCREPVSYPSS